MGSCRVLARVANDGNRLACLHIAAYLLEYAAVMFVNTSDGVRNIKILATPWSAPVWMKDNNSFKGGGLLPANYNVYAQYFVKYIQQMKAEGISIDAVTPQNEPLNPNNNPSLVMTALQQADFIKGSLGPAFQTAGITTKIITYDHNCDVPGYPLTVLQDAQANAFVSGSAFHLYAGDISALSTVHNAYPNKSLYFTEQYTAGTGSFSGDSPAMMRAVSSAALRPCICPSIMRPPTTPFPS